MAELDDAVHDQARQGGADNRRHFVDSRDDRALGRLDGRLGHRLDVRHAEPFRERGEQKRHCAVQQLNRFAFVDKPRRDEFVRDGKFFRKKESFFLDFMALVV